jgi:hypothetical protein
MKRVFSLICVTIMAVVASAQITWNAKGGFGVATCWGGSKTGSHLVGKIGAGIEKPLTSNLSLMPSLEIAWKGAKGEYEVKLDFFYVQIPIMFAYRLNISDSWNTALKVGPYFAYAIDGKYNFHYGTGHDGNKFDAGLDVGIDFEYHKFVFGVESEMGFCKLADGSNGKSPIGDMKNLAFYATVGWKF